MNEKKPRRPSAARPTLALALILGLAAAPTAWAQKVRLATNLGDIVLELDAAKAPRSVENFLQYVKAGHYDGTIFHRVIDGFMIQGGGFTPDRVQKPTGAAIPLEAGNGLSNVRGSLAMARTAAPNSATAQFFINVVDNLPLDNYGGGYAVFGKVAQGMDVVDRIRAVPTVDRGPAFANLPSADVVIRKATLEE
jgi:peptidyl-prolyl cis-trans isomerase A (cyclophilin A)